MQFIYAVDMDKSKCTHAYALAQEDVYALQVPVSNVQGVAVCHAFTGLLHNETRFAFCQATFCAQVIQQGSIFCQFQGKEAVPRSLHYLKHRHDAGMQHFEQDFYLVWEKVGQVALGNFVLVYHFQGNLK